MGKYGTVAHAMNLGICNCVHVVGELTSRDVCCARGGRGLVVHAVLCLDRVVVLVHGPRGAAPAPSAAAAARRGRGGRGCCGGRRGQRVAVHQELRLLQRRRVRRRALKNGVLRL